MSHYRHQEPDRIDHPIEHVNNPNACPACIADGARWRNSRPPTFGTHAVIALSIVVAVVAIGVLIAWRM